MPNSKKRKRQVAANKRQIEKTKKLLEYKSEIEDDKENLNPPNSKLLKYADNNQPEDQATTSEVSGWLGGLYSWCQTGISQGVQTATDVVFPSRVLKRQLEDAQSRLKEMEKELVLVKLQDIREKKRQKRMGESSQIIQCVQANQLPPTAPPPPPPPPLPLPSVPARRIVTRSKTAKLQKVGQKLPSITLDDIKKVKLRTVTEKTVKTTQGGTSSGGSFVISLTDLKNVKLRKAGGRSGDKSAVSSSRRSFHFDQRFTEENDTPEFARKRESLKRMSVTRSPNGSLQFPDRSGLLDCEYGTGVTPMLTRALRRKFQVACPLSPIKSFTPSPLGSPFSHGLPSPSSLTTALPSPPPNSTQCTISPDSILDIREK